MRVSLSRGKRPQVHTACNCRVRSEHDRLAPEAWCCHSASSGPGERQGCSLLQKPAKQNGLAFALLEWLSLQTPPEKGLGLVDWWWLEGGLGTAGSSCLGMGTVVAGSGQCPYVLPKPNAAKQAGPLLS